MLEDSYKLQYTDLSDPLKLFSMLYARVEETLLVKHYTRFIFENV